MKIRVQILSSLLTIISVLTINAAASAQQINDSDLKKNTAPVSNSLSYITRLQPVTYEYNQQDFKQLNLPAGPQIGFTAENVLQVYPAALSSRNSWYTAGKNQQRAITTSQVDADKLVPLLVGAIKEQQEQIEQLKREVQQLKAGK
jgi:hypothetical protein